jgi:hypothetical protein
MAAAGSHPAQHPQGADRPVRAHVEALETLAEKRWFRWCAVSQNVADNPTRSTFGGFSGD